MGVQSGKACNLRSAGKGRAKGTSRSTVHVPATIASDDDGMTRMEVLILRPFLVALKALYDEQGK